MVTVCPEYGLQKTVKKRFGGLFDPGPQVFVDAEPAGPSGAEVACFAAAFGALGFAAARHAAKPAAGQAPATGNGPVEQQKN